MCVDSQNMTGGWQNMRVDSQNMSVGWQNMSVDSQNMSVGWQNIRVDSQNMTVEWENMHVDNQNMAVEWQNMHIDNEFLGFFSTFLSFWLKQEAFEGDVEGGFHKIAPTSARRGQTPQPSLDFGRLGEEAGSRFFIGTQAGRDFNRSYWLVLLI
jgi:hypothetical protein